MARSRLNKLLGPDGIAVCDGAMGTLLYSKGVFINRSFEELNLSQPDLVRSVHEAYLAAGADMIETNTFGANRFKLAPHGFEGLVTQINREGVRLARAAAGPQRKLVAGAMGPLGVRIEPWGPTSVVEARDAFKEQARALVEGGVDLIILETFYHLPELREAVAAVREVSAEVPIVAQVTVTDEGSTPEGIEPAVFARTIAEWDVDAVGVNCGVGPVATLEALEAIRGAIDLPLSAMPNAGQPRNVHGRAMYLSTPEFMASYARRFIKAGVRLVGGCCGTVPEHIKAIKEAVIAVRPEGGRRPALTPDEVARVARPTVPLAERSALGRALAEQRFVRLAQVLPPRGCNPTGTLERVRQLREGGVELVSFPEGLGGARMPSLAIAQLCQREVGVEAVVEFACRQRTLLRMQSELLGAHALGLRNLLLVTGPPPSLGQPETQGALDVDSIGLTNMVQRLNQGLDVGGNPLGDATSFVIGVHLDPYAIDLELEVRRFEWKVEAGAQFAVTPPILDVEAFGRFLARIGHCRIPVIASVSQLASYRDAERVRRETGPSGVPKEVLERLREAERVGREAEVGLEIARATIAGLKGLAQGIQLISDPKGTSPSLELLRED